jgi:diaminohydroxyphosphoribosylaminopyrimidine deaminase/5-amino-6-(5-phosphoribosylamino)uracil reductase
VTDPVFTAIDHAHMAHALRLAERGAYTTRPNPMVGCVLAQGDAVVGKGFHERKGEPHAEVHALRDAGDRARGATAYVTLEPCAHHGSTPPCADALIGAGVARVVAACRDPFPQVDGRGLDALRAAGVVVDIGLMETAARELNRGFFARIERGRPWLRVKLAMSLDGHTAMPDGESKWITSAAARLDAHRWRARAGALLTASGTVLADDPQLTVRLGDDMPVLAPLRVVLDVGLATPLGAHVLDDSAPTLFFHAPDVKLSPTFRERDRVAVAERDGRLDLDAVLRELARRQINEVQLEAGATLAGALLQAGLVDELLLYIAPVLLGEHGRPLFAGVAPRSMAQRLGFRTVDTRQVGPDLRLLLRPEASA